MGQAERQARSREAREAAGFKQVAVMLGPKAVAKLTRWQACGVSGTAAINFLLEQSKPNRPAA
jgi:hypothetical protein